MKSTALLILLAVLSQSAGAKLPAPSDEAKAKAAEATAKTAHGNKVADYQLCQSRERVAERYPRRRPQGGQGTAGRRGHARLR